MLMGIVYVGREANGLALYHNVALASHKGSP